MGEAPGLAARRGAAALIAGVLQEGRPLGEQPGALAKLPPEARARAQALAATVFREMGPLDALLDRFLRKPPPLPVRIVLRIGAAELLVDGVPAHAAVDGAVRLVQATRKTAHLSGLANAVLRRVAAEGPAIWRELAPQPLPGWIAGPVAAVGGARAAEQIAVAHRRAAPLDLTLRDPGTAARWAERLEAEVLPTGTLRRAGGQVTALPGFDDGAWWVQDAAAALPVRLLGELRGRPVLDLCAAPGGKTLQLAAAGAEVTALDSSGARLARLRENLARTRLEARVVEADALDWLAAPGPEVPAILLDAPCSATGTMRRHPELPWLRDGTGLGALGTLQAAMLDRAADRLAPGGRLVYAVCSLLPAEGAEQIAALLARRPELSVIRADPVALGLPEAAACAETGGLRTTPALWPERGGLDGFYMAALTRRG
ncbi:MAG: transcription antitermination factor NusB [Pseudomonadota bacterium]